MPLDDAELETAWIRLLTGLGCSPDASRVSFKEIADRYWQSERFYHNLGHIRAMLETVEQLAGLLLSRPALVLAVWLHDVIYDPRTADSEERSAQYACELLARLHLGDSLAEETARLILLTRTHKTADDDADGQVLLDADLAILGATDDTYDEYARAIRREYAWVPEDAYRVGRARVLEGFLQRPRIFITDALFTRFEKRARLNLRRELAALHS
jgi:predicted metal-dependent HD superfamily phosphohydrolase